MNLVFIFTFQVTGEFGRYLKKIKAIFLRNNVFRKVNMDLLATYLLTIISEKIFVKADKLLEH